MPGTMANYDLLYVDPLIITAIACRLAFRKNSTKGSSSSLSYYRTVVSR